MYDADGRPTTLHRPTPEELEQRAKDNITARAKFEAERAAAAAARAAKTEEKQEAEFKRSVRLRYAMSDQDFERLWPSIRDDELIASAKRLAETPRASDSMYAAF